MGQSLVDIACTGAINSGTFGTVTWGNLSNTNPQVGSVTVGNGANQQTWSDVVLVSNCIKDTWTSGNTVTECRDARGSGVNAFHGHYFSWCFVMRYQHMLCPSPWRVPSANDFRILHTNLTNQEPPAAGSSAAIVADTYMGTVLGQVGGLWGGSHFTGNATSQTGVASRYWSSTEVSAGGTNARYLYFDGTGVWPESEANKSLGFTLRCVR